MLSSPPPGSSTSSDDSVQVVEESQPTEVSFRAAGGSTPGSSGRRKKWKKVSSVGSYVMPIYSETEMRYTTVRWEEAVRIVQKHIQALLGPQESMESSEDEVIKISWGGLKRLVLEAVTFGSLLWDVESFVDSRLPFVFD